MNNWWLKCDLKFRIHSFALGKWPSRCEFMDVPLAREDGNNSRDWNELGLVVDREVPPPPCLVRREELKAEESLECKTNSPILDCGWVKDFPPPFQMLLPPLYQCGGLWRRKMRKKWLTGLQHCRRGRGKAQLRQPAADNGFFRGRRKGTHTASNWSRGILHTSQ